MRSFFAVQALLAVAGLSNAQSIDPSTVPIDTRDSWCSDQKTQCPLICLQLPGVTTETTEENSCDPKTLVWSCVCSNGQTPNETQYSQTIPYYECTEWGNQCVTGCGNDNTCADNCRSQHPCGAQHPNPPNSTTKSTMSATASKTGSASKAPVTGFGGAAATTAASKHSGMAPAFEISQPISLGIMVVGFFAGFAVLL